MEIWIWIAVYEGRWLVKYWLQLFNERGRRYCNNTSWYSVNLKLVKITGVYLSLPTQAGWFPRSGGDPKHIWPWSVRDLHHHAQHFYSTTLSHIVNCCGRYKPIWAVSCISHNISHSPCCQLAQVVAMSRSYQSDYLPAVMQQCW